MSDVFSTIQIWPEVKNLNAAQVPAFGVMRITDINVVETGRVVFKVDQPNAYGDPGQHLINGPAPINSNTYGVGTRAGMVVALYDSNDGTPAFGQFWGPRNGTWKLKKNTPGFLCLGAPTNSGQALALFSPSPMHAVYGKNAGSQINQNSTGTINIFTGTFGGETDSSVTITALARFGNIAANAFVQCFVDQQQAAAVPQWYALQTTC